MLNEKRFIQNIVAEFNRMDNPGERFITPPSHYVEKLNTARRHCKYATEVQLDTAVMTFWQKGTCTLSINVMRWPDTALSELFDIVFPVLYDNRDMSSPNNQKIWLQ